MRDFADQLERRLVIAAQAEAQRGPSRRLWRSALALPRAWQAAPAIVVAAVVAAVVVTTVTTSPAPAPVLHAQVVSFRYRTLGPESGDIIATVTDPFAAQKALDAAFAAHGFHITVSLDPVSPSLVGTVITFSLGNTDPGSQIQPLEGGTCVEGSAGCPIGVKIPATFTGSASITLGRPAQPGEAYAASLSAFGPGESLHCSGLFATQVSAALPQLAGDNLTVEWAHTDANNNTSVDSTPPPGNYYIWNATPVSAGTVRIDSQPTPPSGALVAQGQRYDQGCTS